MLKTILFEWLKHSMTSKKECYSIYFSNVFAIGSLALLAAANYFYFYLENKDIGDFIMGSTGFLFLAVMIRAFSWSCKKKVTEEALPSLAIREIGKIVPYLPAIIRFIPIGITVFTTYQLLRDKIAQRSKGFSLLK